MGFDDSEAKALSIRYDHISKMITITYLGKAVKLGPFNSESDAKTAAQNYCTTNGWPV